MQRDDSLVEVQLSELPEPAARLGTDDSEAGLLPQNGDAHVAIDMPGRPRAASTLKPKLWTPSVPESAAWLGTNDSKNGLLPQTGDGVCGLNMPGRRYAAFTMGPARASIRGHKEQQASLLLQNSDSHAARTEPSTFSRRSSWPAMQMTACRVTMQTRGSARVAPQGAP